MKVRPDHKMGTLMDIFDEAVEVLTASEIRDRHIGQVAVLLGIKDGEWHPAKAGEDAVAAVVNGFEIVKRHQQMQLIVLHTDRGKVVGVTGSRRFQTRRLVHTQEGK